MTKILCDTDFLISLHIENESTHLLAQEIYSQYFIEDFYILNLTLYETATVLSRKLNQSEAIGTLEIITENFPQQIIFDSTWEVEVFDLYKSFNKKNISFFDCCCQVVANNFQFKIASFDSFYPKDLLVK